MEVVLTSRPFIEVLHSKVLTASTTGELLPQATYDAGDSLTTDYIAFPVNVMDAIWEGFLIERVRAWMKVEQEVLIVPSFRLYFTPRLGIQLTKGNPIVVTPDFEVTDFYGQARFQIGGWQKLINNIYLQEIQTQFFVPVSGRDLQTFAQIEASGEFSLNATLTFELLAQRV